jgi:hypothetical protein
MKEGALMLAAGESATLGRLMLPGVQMNAASNVFFLGLVR